MADRAEVIARFLAANDWRAENLYPLADDASFRSYRRLIDGERRAVLMNAPPAHEDVRPYLRMARHLRGLGLSAPAIYAADESAGLLLIEDLGDMTFTRLLAAGADETALYRLAVDVLGFLHAMPAEQAIGAKLPGYDERRLLDEALLLVDWYLPAVYDRPVTDSARTACIDAWRRVLPIVLAQPATLVLRDYHVDNLMRLDGRAGLSACGLLDFQDAVAGPAAYDLMSLLEDARRDISEPLRAAMLARYREAVAPDDWSAFMATYAVLAAQRHAKVIGIFTRLCRRDGKFGYLAHIPRVWRLLERALAQPALAPVAAWFDKHVPASARIIPVPQKAAS